MTVSRIPAARAILVGVPAAVLVVCVALSIWTRGAMGDLPFLTGQGGGGVTASGLVDQKPFLTAQAVAPTAATAEEQELAREAERLADHEVDQAFAMALRQAEMETRKLSGPALELQQKLNGLAELVKEDQTKVDVLTAQMAASTKGGATAAETLANDLDVAKAQLQLETDELNDATDDLARESGDKRGQIQQELNARQAAMQEYDSQVSSGGQTAVVSAKRFSTLAGQSSGWSDQRSRRALLVQARQQADETAAALTAQHVELETRSSTIGAKLSAATDLANAPPDTAAAGVPADGRLAQMGQMHGLAQIHAILDDRMTTEHQLAAVYAKWIAQVDLQHRILLHLIVQSIAGIASLVLGGILVWWLTKRLLAKSAMDKRSVHTLETVARLGIQLVTLLLVLLVIFGAPDHVPTILGLATAGLTVVFQDFILAFFGWFVLMGRNGIRVGDWVEINGVGGEVVEIGLFRTALLETGNWTDKGHPTGRRVTFINNFAVTGQFFNFSTAGQWMWDEISVNVPSGEGTYKTIEAIHTAVLKQTERDATLAEAEWKVATKQQGLGQFSAKPSVDMRPAAAGIDILVRYVTRAADRFEMRNRLYQTVIELLHTPPQADAITKIAP